MRLRYDFSNRYRALERRTPKNQFFDWVRFLQSHSIPFVTRGPNTARGHVSIKCPWCNQRDPSEHMGLRTNPRNPEWGCLRDPDHRGRTPQRLIMQLLGCGFDLADSMVKSSAPELDDYENLVSQVLYGDAKDEVVEVETYDRVLEFPKEFRVLNRVGYAQYFLDYLRGRGLEPSTLCASRFDIHYAVTGRFRWRLILPFYHYGQLVGWTGRAIGKKATLRYLTLPSDEEGAKKLGMPPALTNPEEYVWKQDAVQAGGDVLVIAEGPFDAVKLEWCRPDPGFVPTCVFGMPKPAQVTLLANAARKYSRVLVILDRGVMGIALKMASEIEELSGVVTKVLEPIEKDPGAMSRVEISDMLEGGLD